MLSPVLLGLVIQKVITPRQADEIRKLLSPRVIGTTSFEEINADIQKILLTIA